MLGKTVDSDYQRVDRVVLDHRVGEAYMKNVGLLKVLRE